MFATAWESVADPLPTPECFDPAFAWGGFRRFWKLTDLWEFRRFRAIFVGNLSTSHDAQFRALIAAMASPFPVLSR